MSRAELDEVVTKCAKQRFAFAETGTLIRASQGHSVRVDLELSDAPPPEILFHGTATRFLPSIRAEGLRPMKRHAVHLSATRETAWKVGARMLTTGLVVFIPASAVCMLAPGIGWLVTGRALQGAGAAILLPATLSLIPHLYPEGPGRARATVRWVGTGALAMAVAPLAGGLLIETAGWRGVFAVNLPAGAVAWWLIRRGVPETPRREDVGLDPAGQLLAIAALSLLATGTILTGSHAWTSQPVAGCLGAAAVALAAFVLHQRRSSDPLVPGRILRDRPRAVAIASAGVMGFVFYGALLALSITLQGNGWSALKAGLALLPMTVASTVGPLIAYHRLARRYRPASILAGGFAAVGLGAAGMWLAADGSYAKLIPTMLLIGGASTICFSALTALLVSRTPAADSGIASALQNTTRQIGALLAYAVIGSVFARTSSPGLATAAIILTAVTAAALAAVLATARAKSPAP